MQIIIGGILLLVIGYLLIGVVRKHFFALLFLTGAIWAAFAYTSYFFWTLGVGFVLLLIVGYLVQVYNLRNIRLECEPLLKRGDLEQLIRKYLDYDSDHKKQFLKEYGGKFSRYAVDGDKFLRRLLAEDVISFSWQKVGNRNDVAIFEKKDGDEYLEKAWGFMDGWGIDKAVAVLNECGIRVTEQSIFNQKEKKPVVLITVRLADEEESSDPHISCGQVIDLD